MIQHIRLSVDLSCLDFSRDPNLMRFQPNPSLLKLKKRSMHSPSPYTERLCDLQRRLLYSKNFCSAKSPIDTLLLDTIEHPVASYSLNKDSPGTLLHLNMALLALPENLRGYVTCLGNECLISLLRLNFL